MGRYFFLIFTSIFSVLACRSPQNPNRIQWIPQNSQQAKINVQDIQDQYHLQISYEQSSSNLVSILSEFDVNLKNIKVRYADKKKNPGLAVFSFSELGETYDAISFSTDITQHSSLVDFSETVWFFNVVDIDRNWVKSTFIEVGDLQVSKNSITGLYKFEVTLDHFDEFITGEIIFRLSLNRAEPHPRP